MLEFVANVRHRPSWNRRSAMDVRTEPATIENLARFKVSRLRQFFRWEMDMGGLLGFLFNWLRLPVLPGMRLTMFFHLIGIFVEIVAVPLSGNLYGSAIIDTLALAVSFAVCTAVNNFLGRLRFRGCSLHLKQVKRMVEYERLAQFQSFGYSRKHVTMGYSKDPQSLWAAFVGLCDRGTFMISYCHEDGRELPKTLALMFPAQVCWIDFMNLVPGASIKNTIVEAAQNAKFRFVFLSHKYLQSDNCLAEFEVIKKEPHKCCIFWLDEVEENHESPFCKLMLQNLEANAQQLVLILKMSELRAGGMVCRKYFDRLFLIEKLSDFGVLRALFQQQSPGINLGWLHTAAKLVDQPHIVKNKLTRRLLVNLSILVVIATLLAVVFAQEKTQFPSGGILVAFVASILSSLVMFAYSRDVSSLGALPDAGLLLIVLRHLGISPAVRVSVCHSTMSTPPRGIDAPVSKRSRFSRRSAVGPQHSNPNMQALKNLAKFDVIHIDTAGDMASQHKQRVAHRAVPVPTRSPNQTANQSPHFTIRCLEESSATEQLVLDGSTLYWTNHPEFKLLPTHQKEVLKDSFVNLGGPPSLNTILVRLLACGLGTSTDHLRMGFSPFDHILKEMTRMDREYDDGTLSTANYQSRVLEHKRARQRWRKWRWWHNLGTGIFTRLVALFFVLVVLWFASYGMFFLINFSVHPYVACHHDFIKGPSCKWIDTDHPLDAPIFAFDETSPFVLDRKGTWGNDTSTAMFTHNKQGHHTVVPYTVKLQQNDSTCIKCSQFGVDAPKCSFEWAESSDLCN